MGRESWWLRRAKCMRHATNIRQQCTAPFAVQWAWHLTRISDRLTTSELLPVTNAHTHTHTHTAGRCADRPTDRLELHAHCAPCAVIIVNRCLLMDTSSVSHSRRNSLCMLSTLVSHEQTLLHAAVSCVDYERQYTVSRKTGHNITHKIAKF